jgi:hypothetical protein
LSAKREDDKKSHENAENPFHDPSLIGYVPSILADLTPFVKRFFSRYRYAAIEKLFVRAITIRSARKDRH